ncbi:MAG: glycosyltransferase [Thermodesulfobacteriota bacterium]
MDLLLLGSRYFQEALTGLGHRVVHFKGDGRPDPHLPEVLAGLSFRPQAVVLTDDLGRRVLPTGLEGVDLPKVWYGVDGPINFFWHKHWAALFDLVLIDQKQSARQVEAYAARPVLWLPVAVDTAVYQGRPGRKACDLAFVGVINPKVRPKRSRILDRLARRFHVVVAGGRQGRWVSPGEAGALYRSARIVLNENLFPGVTTRMFEATAAGSFLLTEGGAEGLGEIFRPGREMDVYGPEDLVEKVAYYLGHEKEREEAAARGRAKTLAGHDIRHRAGFLVEKIEGLPPGAGSVDEGLRCREQGKALFLVGLRWPGHDGPGRRRRAETMLARAVALGAGDPETFLYLGQAAWLRRDFQQARSLFFTAAEAGSVRAALALGHLAAAGPAAALFQKAALRAGFDFPTSFGPAGSLTADQHYLLGRTLEARGHGLCPGFSRYGLAPLFWTALEHYRTALETDPGHVPTLKALGELLCAHGAFVEAQEFMARAAGLAPDELDLAAAAARTARRGYFSEEEARKVA